VKPRLRDVAELAGVSEATVSRVVNERPGVAETTRREVLRALHQLGYEPTGIRPTRRTRLVGLIVPELDNPAFPRFAQAIESRLASKGLTTVLCTSTPSGMGENDYLDVLLDHEVVGIVIVSGTHADMTADHSRYRDLADRGVPTVLVNGSQPGLGPSMVTVDHADAARQAVTHLASLGHERIGLAVGPSRYLPSLDLMDGFREGLEQAGLPADDACISETLYSIEGGHVAGLRLIEAGATAIMAASDPMALGVLQAAREERLQVPRELSVVGFDDAGPNAYVAPPLTSIQQPFEAMANAILRLLDEAMSDRNVPVTSLRFTGHLVVRGSTAPPKGLVRNAPPATWAHPEDTGEE
jgi:LacI family transcriptional regulator, repressor for deo operon, udp, cdd, tsx, nupC, and nupG